MYIFYPIFHCGLYIRAVSITDNLCTKQGNSSIFEPKTRGYKSKAGYIGARTVLDFRKIISQQKLETKLGYFLKDENVYNFA